MLNLQETAANTALKRKALPAPARHINPEDVKHRMCLHLGCGQDRRTADALMLMGAMGVVEHDPNHLPNRAAMDATTFDLVVNLYVANVLPPAERMALYMDIHGHLNPGGCAYIAVRGKRSVESAKSKQAHQDGYLVKNRGQVNFQKGYTRTDIEAELQAWFTVETIINVGGDLLAIVRKGGN